MPASESLHQLESRIQASVIAKLPQAMEQDNLPERLGVFPSAIPKGLHRIMPKIHAQSQQLHGQIESQNQSIQVMFETHLSHIRGLLAKLPREDGE